MAMAAPTRHQSHFRIIHLALTGFMAELYDRLDDVIHSRIVCLRQQSAMSVDRELTA